MNSTLHNIQRRSQKAQDLFERSFWALLFVAFVSVGALIVAADVLIPSRTKVALEVGDVAPRDLLAPRSLKYESEVLTQAKREAEMARVRPVYDPPDPAIKSEQLQLARQILDYIENVLLDDYATPAQQQTDLRAITELSLSDNVIAALTAIEDEAQWRAVDDQVIRLLERVMSGEVREDTIQVEREGLGNRISASYTESEVRIITAIVEDLIRVNAFYNEELTAQARQEAGANISPEIRNFAKGQMIIRAGEIVSPAHIEALEQFGLLQAARRHLERLVGAAVVMVLIAMVLGLYVRTYCPQVYGDPPFLAVLAVLFLGFMAGAQIVSSDDRVQFYYYPAAALAFLLVTLVDLQLAMVAMMTLAALGGIMTGGTLEFAVVVALSSATGVLALGHSDRLNAYFRAGLAVGGAAMLVALFFGLNSDSPPPLFTVLSQLVGAIVNGLLSAALALVGLYLITNILNIPTSLKIVELQQPNHPLLQRLVREAPGTYQHSLQVANLAELGAQRIDANAALVRVAAMYHDVGKILNPYYFVENQVDGVNPHEVLNDPWHSARIILGHVTEGERLARRYRLPYRLRDFILEHHGTTLVQYFYQKAVEQAAETGSPIDPADFRYNGPCPRSRETAVLMLADGCESSVRARRPQSKDDVEETVDYIFQSRLSERQLDQSGLTLNDLRSLRDTYVTALQGVFHPRIAYPGAPGQASTALTAAKPEQLAARGTAELPAQESAASGEEASPQVEPAQSEKATKQKVPKTLGPTPKPPATE